jgi:glyoxalase family protein
MDTQIHSLHHVTATVTDAQQDLDFYAGLLGQRLVKKTVNFDNPHVYHFYYGNERGEPGTIMTTFPYKGMGVRPGIQGAGQVTVTSFSAPTTALPFWRTRLAERGVAFRDDETAFGEPTLIFGDPSGLTLRIVASDTDDRAPWTAPGIEAAHAIRGLQGVSLLVPDPAKTVEVITGFLDGTIVNENAAGIRVAVGGDAPGHVVEVLRATDVPPAMNGLGTVHHVAFAITDGQEQKRLRAELVQRGFSVTAVLDRQYFTSIYFREPNGVLFEVATLPPGFAVDEPVESLGAALKLPPWEEPRRASIEAALPTLQY